MQQVLSPHWIWLAPAIANVAEIISKSKVKEPTVELLVTSRGNCNVRTRPVSKHILKWRGKRMEWKEERARKEEEKKERGKGGTEGEERDESKCVRPELLLGSAASLTNAS